MRRKHPAQTLVEFALILPILLMIIMGTIDGSYYIYTWAQVQFAARRGAEQASKLPPANLSAADTCYAMVLTEAKRSGALVPIQDDEVTVTYFRDLGSGNGPSRFAATDIATGRNLGQVVEVHIAHEMEPLTPLFRSMFGDTINVVNESRRTIVAVHSPLRSCE